MRTKREPNGWTPGSGHICSDHFSADDYEGFGAKVAGFSSELVLKKNKTIFIFIISCVRTEIKVVYNRNFQ